MNTKNRHFMVGDGKVSPEMAGHATGVKYQQK